MDTVRVLTDDPGRLLEIRGIGKKTAAKITSSWTNLRSERDLMIRLFAFGIGPGAARRIIARYGNASPLIVKENPYILAEEVDGIGFRRADALARELGIPADSEFRMTAGLIYAMQNAVDEGHTYLPKDELIGRAERMLEVESEAVQRGLDELLLGGQFIQDGSDIYGADLHAMECLVSRKLNHLASMGRFGEELPPETHLLMGELDAYQQDAVRMGFMHGLVIVTGVPVRERPP